MPTVRHRLYGWKIWGDDGTKISLDKMLTKIYCKIFSVHINKDILIEWMNLPMEYITLKSKNIVNMLNLPTIDHILENIENKTKYKPI